jgi:membrane fusion protein (multidrug efflux system)
MVVTAACTPFIQTVEPTPTLIARTESVRQRPMARVERGQLIEAIRTTARVEALDRTELFFKSAGRLKTLSVAQGDSVKKGDIIAELETGRLDTDIESSQEALKNAELRLDAAKTRARDERASAQRAVADAELKLEVEQEAFTRLLRRSTAEQIELLGVTMDGREVDKSPDVNVIEAEAVLLRAKKVVQDAERKVAELTAAGNVTREQAQAESKAVLSGLQADLLAARESQRVLEAGSSSTEASPRQRAQIRVDTAVAAVAAAKSALTLSEQKYATAQASLTNIDAVARANAVEELERLKSKIAAKRVTVVTSEETLNALANKPTPTELLEAEQTLEKARLTRDDITRSSSSASAAKKEKADLDYQAAQRVYTEAVKPATPSSISSARADLNLARSELVLLENQKTEILSGESEAETIRRQAEKYKNGIRAEASKAAANRDVNRQKLQDAEIILSAMVGQGTLVEAVERVAAAISVDQGSALATAKARIQGAQAKVDQYLRGQTPEDAIARHASQIVASGLNAIPSAQAALEAAQADVRAQELRYQEIAGVPKLSQLNVAFNNEEAARLAFMAASDNLERFKRGESATDFELQILKNDVERSRISLEALLTQSEENVIRAPFDGVVTFTRGRAGSEIRAFDEIIGVSDPSRLVVEVRIPDEAHSKMSVGQLVEVRLDSFPGAKFEGSVSEIPRTIVTQSGQTVRIPNAIVDVSFDQVGMQMGMLARVNITLQVKDDVLKIPVTAVRDMNERTFVETIVSEQRRSLPVTTGIRSDSEIEIISGLDEGQMIFAAP